MQTDEELSDVRLVLQEKTKNLEDALKRHNNCIAYLELQKGNDEITPNEKTLIDTCLGYLVD